METKLEIRTDGPVLGQMIREAVIRVIGKRIGFKIFETKDGKKASRINWYPFTFIFNIKFEIVIEQFSEQIIEMKKIYNIVYIFTNTKNRLAIQYLEKIRDLIEIKFDDFFCFDYKHEESPFNYTCDKCEKNNHKLWYNIKNFPNVRLLCFDCMLKEYQDEDRYIPAVPLSNNTMFFRDEHIDKKELDWWMSLKFN